jgi:polyisoprenoid-binding protein YceI
VGLLLAAAVLVTASTWGYINLIRDEAPERLTLDAARAPTGQASTTTVAGDRTWKVTGGSQVGYRVDEVLFGQRAEAVGRTSDVSGTIDIDGTTVVSGSFTADLTTVRSDESRRDNQFRGRIMDVARFPTARFELTEPIRFDSLPGEGQQVTTPPWAA